MDEERGVLHLSPENPPLRLTQAQLQRGGACNASFRSLHVSKAHCSRESVRSVLLRALAIVCALQVSGAHWLALQTVAWTGMLVTRSQQAGVEEAMRTTFDGQHP